MKRHLFVTFHGPAPGRAQTRARERALRSAAPRCRLCGVCVYARARARARVCGTPLYRGVSRKRSAWRLCSRCSLRSTYVCVCVYIYTLRPAWGGAGGQVSEQRRITGESAGRRAIRRRRTRRRDLLQRLNSALRCSPSADSTRRGSARPDRVQPRAAQDHEKMRRYEFEFKLS